MKAKVLPLLTLESDEHAKAIGVLLVQNGFDTVEVTFRSDAAPQVIKAMGEIEGLSVGAGTVVSVEQAQAALDNGAKFIITPGINEAVIEYCLAKNIPVYPGVVTPSEIEKCRTYGLKTLKLFPAGIFGGLELIKAYYGPYKDFKFIPTGGVNRKNMREFLKQPNVAAIGGSFILNNEYIQHEAWEALHEDLKALRGELNEFVSTENS